MATAPSYPVTNQKELQMGHPNTTKFTTKTDPAQEQRAPEATGTTPVAERIANMPGSPIARRAWSRHRWGRRFDFQQVRGFNIVTTVAV